MLSFLIIAAIPAEAQYAWDLEGCRRFARADRPEHVCTPEHLEADFAELLRSTPTTGPGSIKFLRRLAESGYVESAAAVKEAAGASERANTALYEPSVRSNRQTQWLAKETVALKGIKTVSVIVEDGTNDGCRPTDEALRLSATITNTAFRQTIPPTGGLPSGSMPMAARSCTPRTCSAAVPRGIMTFEAEN
jgi:hypothetical protein